MRTLRTDVIEPLAATYGGRLFKTTGDGFLVEFKSAVQAFSKAVEEDRDNLDAMRGLAQNLLNDNQPEAALEPDFARVVSDGFRRIAPLVDALNGAILAGEEKPRRPLF